MPGHVLNVHEFLTPEIARDMGHGARKLLFGISAAGAPRLGRRDHYEQFLGLHSGRGQSRGQGGIGAGPAV